MVTFDKNKFKFERQITHCSQRAGDEAIKKYEEFGIIFSNNETSRCNSTRQSKHYYINIYGALDNFIASALTLRDDIKHNDSRFCT